MSPQSCNFPCSLLLQGPTCFGNCSPVLLMPFSYANSLKVSFDDRFSVINLACLFLNRSSVYCASVDLLNHLQNPRPDRLCFMLHKNDMLSSRIKSRAGADLRSDQRHATGHELDRHQCISLAWRGDDREIDFLSEPHKLIL